MPLYMDFHKLDTSDITKEEMKKIHDEDLAIQERFGVFELKYWVNLEAKNLFCLAQAPNKEAFNEVHKQSHGKTACNIIEVSEEEFNLYFGVGKSVHDLAHTESGEIDTGFRTILLLSQYNFSGQNDHFLKEVYRLIEHHKGTRVIHPDEDILVSFIFASNAILCAKAIHKLLIAIPDTIEYSISLVSGRPVDEIGIDIFEEAKKKVQYLCALGLKNSMYLDYETKVLSDKERMSSKISMEDFSIVNNEDFVFLFKLYHILDKEFDQSSFKSADIDMMLGLSKSQAYRKIKSLTGLAANQLIQEFRLRKSLKILRQNSKPISETAFDLGFNSPAYFAKLFRKRFNATPKHFAKITEDL